MAPGGGGTAETEETAFAKTNNLGWGDRCGNLPRVRGHVLANQAEQVLRGVEGVVELISGWAARPGHGGSGQRCLLQRQAVPPPCLALDYIMFQGTRDPCSKIEGFQDGEGRAVSQAQALFLVGSSAMHGGCGADTAGSGGVCLETGNAQNLLTQHAHG